MQHHQQNQTMLRNFKLQMQPQAVPVSDFSILTKPNYSKIFVLSDLAPDPSAGLDSGGVITRVFSETSNHDPHISRLKTQTRFITPPICDIETEITKPTYRKIFVSSDMGIDASAGFDSKGLIAQGFCGPFLLNSSCHDFEKVDEGRNMSSQMWVRMAGYRNYI